MILKNVNELEVIPHKTNVQLKELALYKALLPFKYNDEDIHPNYSKFFIYFSKTKRTTTVEIRKRINQILRNVDFTHAHSQNFVTKMKGIINSLGKEVMEEIEELVLDEETRIKDYREGASKRKKFGNYINKNLAEIAPKIIEDLKGKNNFYTNLRFSKNRIGFFITPNVGKDREIVTEFLKRGKKSEQLKIDDFDDENDNYFITFSDPDDLAFMRGILSNRYMKEPLEGIKLLGIPLQKIIGSCQYKGMKLEEPEWHEHNFNTYYESIKRSSFAFNNRAQIKTYTDDSIRYVINELMAMTKFNSELELSCYLHYNFLLPI